MKLFQQRRVSRINSSGRSRPAGARILALVGLAMLLTLPVGRPLLTQARFDPATVQPDPCRGGDYRCGYQPTTPALRSSIPLAAADGGGRGLPSRVDFSSEMPPVGHQGRQGSCVAWSTGYAVRSYQEDQERDWGYDSPFSGGGGNRVFSPAYIYNQINGGRDNGSFMVDAARLLVSQGAAPWKTMPYNPNNYRARPPSAAKSAASRYRARSYSRLNPHDLKSIKAQLAQKNPVVVGMVITDSFYQLGRRTHDHDAGRSYGGHAVALVGYNDSHKSERGDRGAFKVYNSWGREWGQSGMGWVSYRHFQRITKEAMVIQDRRDSTTQPRPPTPPATKQLAAPSEVRASRGQFRDRVQVAWAAVKGARAYRVYRASPGSNTYRALAYVATTNYSDKKIQPDVAYRYRIAAHADDRKSDVKSSPVAQGYAKSAQQVRRPTKIAGLRGQANERGQVRLQWSPAAGASAYEVIRWEAKRKRWKLLRRVSATVFQDTSPARAAANRYRVRGRGQGGAGPWSAVIAVRVGGGAVAPAVVTGVRATKGRFRDRIKVAWRSSVGAANYYLYRVDTRTFESGKPVPVSGTSFLDRSAAARSGRPVGYVVIAANAAGHSDFSEPVLGFSSPNMKRAGEVLDPPANLKGTVNDARGTLDLSWSPVKGAAEYYLFRKEDGDDEFKFVRALPAGKTRTAEKLPTEKDSLFWYTVRSKSALGGESGDAALIPAFVNSKREIVRERASGGPGLERFLGRWTALDWDGNGAPAQMELSISSQGDRFAAELRKAGRTLRKFSGTYAVGSDILESDGFSMQFQAETGASVVEIPAASGLGDGLNQAFVKEK